MATAPDAGNAALEFVRSLAGPDPAPDGVLLTRTLAGDQAAFTTIVRRHGPMVLGVCRRVLRNDADAEDAGQAVFLVLARRMHRLTADATVGDWLHGVAVRTALKARAKRARRAEVESRAARPAAVEPAVPDDVTDAVDRAVRALPAKLRDAVVLCELAGVSRADAAGRLGVPVGTLASRLAAARVRLLKRLGPAFGAVLLGPAAASDAFAAACGRGPTGAVPAAVLLLVTEVTRMMAFTKLKLAVVSVLVAAAVTGGGVAVTRRADAAGRGTSRARHRRSRPPLDAERLRTAARRPKNGFVK